MSNQLDEMNEVLKEEGRDINVIAKQLPVNVRLIDYLLAYSFFAIGLGIIIFSFISGKFLLSIVGLAFIGINISKLKSAETYFEQLQQRVQQQASQVDNYLENRVIILQNTAKLVEKAVELDKELLTNIAKLRSGNIERNQLNNGIEKISNDINVILENYPDIKSHSEIRDAMQQNSYLQKEITAARDLYNDVVYIWNREIFVWPFNKVIAAKKGLTTRVPFIASKEIKEKSREIFF